jgi:hypothetical protein
MIFPVVLYGLETWSVTLATLMEEHMLRLPENMLLGKIFGPKMEEVTGTGGNCII